MVGREPGTETDSTPAQRPRTQTRKRNRRPPKAHQTTTVLVDMTKGLGRASAKKVVEELNQGVVFIIITTITRV